MCFWVSNKRLNEGDVSDMSWQDAVKTSVTGLGYDLVEIERSAAGLLRITIDMPFTPGTPEQMVTVEDCEVVTKQLRFFFEVENVDYHRLEVGSPGIDRLLRNDADLERFTGEMVDVILKEPIGVTDSGISANRKKFRGLLEAVSPGQWQLVWSAAPPVKSGVKVGKKRAAEQAEAMRALQFEWADVREARLASIVDFRGRKSKSMRETSDS